MSTETQEVAQRYALIPGVGVGPLRFGDRVTDHPSLRLRDPEPEYGAGAGDEYTEYAEYAEYGLPALGEAMDIYVDGEGRIHTVSFYEFCVIGRCDLIGMGVGQLLVTLGLPTTIEPEGIGRAVELLYVYESRGLRIWTTEGQVCVVQAGAVQPVT